jgi:hypothetical protein
MLLISDTQLIEAVMRLEKNWKNQSYSDIQRNNISSHLRKLTQSEADQVVLGFCLGNKSLPLPLDIIDSVKNQIRKRNAGTVEVFPPREVECPDCMETGYCFVIVEEMLVLGRCRCEFGRPCDPAIPLVDSKYMQIADFPVEKFKPTQAEIDLILAGKASGIPRVQWWKGVKKISKEYWAQKGKT